MIYSITMSVYNEDIDDIDDNVELEVDVDYYPGRLGASADSYYGPTPDEPETVEIEEIRLNGEDVTEIYEDLIETDDILETLSNFLDPYA